jgi:murein DD-endopeptidase MepM/ murein hydrolase activator NlpD
MVLRLCLLLLVFSVLAGCSTPAATAPTSTLVPPASSTTPEPATATAIVSTASATPEAATTTSAPTTTQASTPSAIAAVTLTPAPSAEATATTVPAPTVGLSAPSASAPATTAPAPTVGLPAPSAEATAAPNAAGYVFPVQDAQVEYGAAHHDYPAADIFCPVGSSFVAPVGGTVNFVSAEDQWDPGSDDPALRGGISVAIVGDDGVRYYGSHLSAVADGIAVGQRVEAGQLLGLTGKSGNARSTPAHLHFGISRPTTPDDWSVRRGEVPPYPYLQAWQRGEDLRPVLP